MDKVSVLSQLFQSWWLRLVKCMRRLSRRRGSLATFKAELLAHEWSLLSFLLQYNDFLCHYNVNHNFPDELDVAYIHGSLPISPCVRAYYTSAFVILLLCAFFLNQKIIVVMYSLRYVIRLILLRISNHCSCMVTFFANTSKQTNQRTKNKGSQKLVLGCEWNIYFKGTNKRKRTISASWVAQLVMVFGMNTGWALQHKQHSFEPGLCH